MIFKHRSLVSHTLTHRLSVCPSISLMVCLSVCPSVPQLVVWGNYGRMERKCFMGMSRILLEELDLSTVVVGWYKLFPTSSMVDPATGPLMRHSSQISLESTVGPCCDRP